MHYPLEVTLVRVRWYSAYPQSFRQIEEMMAERDVWIGALVTAVLFEAGKLLIGLYLGKSGITGSFAATGSLVVLPWVYYAAQVFLLGVEFTKVCADAHGSHKPAQYMDPGSALR